MCYLIVQVRTGEAKSHEVPDPDPVSDWSSSCPSPLVRPPPPGLRRTGASGPGLVPMLSPPTGWWVREMPAPFLLAGSTHTPGKGGSRCAGQVGVWGEGGGAYYPARAWFARGSEVAQSPPPPPRLLAAPGQPRLAGFTVPACVRACVFLGVTETHFFKTLGTQPRPDSRPLSPPSALASQRRLMPMLPRPLGGDVAPAEAREPARDKWTGTCPRPSSWPVCCDGGLYFHHLHSLI